MEIRSALIALVTLLLLVAAPAQSEDVREISWEDLIPEGWVPPAVSIDHFFDAPPAPASVADSPIVPAMDQQRVRLPGYLVPLDVEGESLRTFLMVPYFGACIHVPPPPPNQIVYVEMPEAISLDDPYGAHWVTGVMSTKASSTSLAETSYSMRGELVEVFDWEAFYDDQQTDP